jgi:hypothetical protein
MHARRQVAARIEIGKRAHAVQASSDACWCQFFPSFPMWGFRNALVRGAMGRISVFCRASSARREEERNGAIVGSWDFPVPALSR